MKKIHIPAIFLFLVLCAATAFAASLTLADKDAGYSLALPEGWEPMDAPTLQRMASQACAMVPDEKAKAEVTKKAQGAMLPGTTPPQYVLLVPVPNSAMNITTKDLAELKEPGSNGLKEFEQGMSGALKRSGAAMGDSRMLADGISVAASFSLPGGSAPKLFQTTQVRFTKNNMLIVMGLYPGKGNEYNDKTMQAILDGLVISPENSLSSISAPSSARGFGFIAGCLLVVAAGGFALVRLNKKKKAQANGPQ